jgi:hypothetical protein
MFNRLNSLQQQIDAAHDVMNSHMMMRRSLAMTINELSDMKVDTTPLTKKLPDIDQSISEAAKVYLDKKIQNETEIQNLRSEMSAMETTNTESVIDFSGSSYISLPLSVETLNMDSQYFSFGSNMEDDMIANIEKFIRTSTKNIPNVSDKTAKDVSTQITNQVQNHSISGTLIIVASCTHRNIGTFNPLAIDTEKVAQVWNILHPDNPIDLTQDLTKKKEDGDKESLSIITGASYGSSFVGMVHILKADSKQMGEFEKLKTEFENKLRIGGWLANSTGGVGVNESALGDIRAFLSNQSINCHVSIITTGAIPGIASSELTLSIEKLAKVDKSTMQSALTIGRSEIPSTDAQAYEARQKKLLLSIEDARVNQILQGVQHIDQVKNKTLDINSLMDAFTNYINIISGKNGIASGNQIIGAPVSFYVRHLTKGDIVRMHNRKYQTTETADKKPEATKPKTPFQSPSPATDQNKK